MMNRTLVGSGTSQSVGRVKVLPNMRLASRGHDAPFQGHAAPIVENTPNYAYLMPRQRALQSLIRDPSIADSSAHPGFPTRSIVQDDMAPVVREFVPSPRFLASSGATEAVASTAIELADIDTGRFNGHEICRFYQGYQWPKWTTLGRR
jgi:hypothetical protein